MTTYIIAIDKIVGADSDETSDDDKHPEPLEPFQLPLQEDRRQDSCIIRKYNAQKQRRHKK